MPSSIITELALRAAVNKSSRDVTDAGGQAASITDIAMKRVESLGASVVPSSGGLQAEAIGLAVAGVALGYTAIAAQVGRLKNQRLDLYKEIEAGIATFTIPTEKEPKNLSSSERVIKGFLELTTMNPLSTFSKYLGIHSGAPSADAHGKFYSVLPFYRMSEALAQPLASAKPLDRQRSMINLYLRSAIPAALDSINVGFQTDWKLVSFVKSTFESDNYLNDRRAPRFIIMSLSNLLWNLQHPVDPETGFSLTLTTCIEMCRDVEILLNQLLNTTSSSSLQNIDSHENELMSFLRRYEVTVQALRAAYQEEQLHELNIEEVTDAAHQTVRKMDIVVFELMYKKHKVDGNDDPDDKAAETLADKVTYLNMLLTVNPLIIKQLGPVPEWIPSWSGVNMPPVTIVDILIIFCHLSARDRDRLLGTLELSAKSTEIEFAKALREFGRQFVKPIKTMCRDDLQVKSYSSSSKHRQAHCETARRLVPFITLVIEDYRIEVDTPESYELAKKSSGALRIYSGKQQAQAINLSAQRGGEYYTWDLSTFTGVGTEEIDKLPKYQYRMTQVTKLMDSVSELVLNYRSFLLQKSFQQFLLKCLEKVKKEYNALEESINETDLCLAHNEGMSRNMKAILVPMTGALNKSVEAFALATTNFERVVSAPDFTDQQRQLLSTKLGAIAAQFSLLFNDEDSGLAEFLDLPPITSAISSATPNLIAPASSLLAVVKSKEESDAKITALKALVQRCFDSLSFQSAIGHKGMVLKELLQIMSRKDEFTEGEIKHVVMELARVTASYRETWFFQAAYGQTRSAKTLISAIKDPALNKVLPLASIIFDQVEINITQVDDALVQRRLTSLRDGNRNWREPSSAMRLNWPMPLA